MCQTVVLSFLHASTHSILTISLEEINIISHTLPIMKFRHKSYKIIHGRAQS